MACSTFQGQQDGHPCFRRPAAHFTDMEATPVSDQVKRIVEFINTHPRSNRRVLVETLSPTPPPAPIPVAAPAVEGAPATEAPKPPAQSEPTPEQASIIGDLHCRLIHEGASSNSQMAFWKLPRNHCRDRSDRPRPNLPPLRQPPPRLRPVWLKATAKPPPPSPKWQPSRLMPRLMPRLLTWLWKQSPSRRWSDAASPATPLPRQKPAVRRPYRMRNRRTRLPQLEPFAPV